MKLPDAPSWKGVFAITVWGASFVATRIALNAFSPFGLVAARLIAAAVLLMLIVRASGQSFLPRRADIPVGVLMGVTLAAHLLLQSYGLEYTSAINTGWIIGFIPVTVAVGAHLLGQQRIRPTGWLGVLVGAGGVVLVMVQAPPDFAKARSGDLLQIASCVTWTVYTLASVGPMVRNGALRMTTLAVTVAAVVTTAITAASRTTILREPVTAEILLAVAFLGLICGGVAYYLWFKATDEQGPTRVAALLYVQPFITLAAASIRLREPITANAVAGGLCVLLGVWLVAHGSRRPTP